jgi:uncharacterized protein YkwD
MNKFHRLAGLSMLALSVAFASAACTNPSSDDEDLSVGDAAGQDVTEEDGDLGETQDELKYSCTSVSNANWLDSSETLETSILNQVNALRASGTTCNGVWIGPKPALTLNTSLRCAARSHARDVATNIDACVQAAHTGSDGTTLGKRITQAGYSWSAAAENISCGATTATAIVNGWKTSTAGHCQNMMSANVTQFGAGFFYRADAKADYDHWGVLVLAKPL